MTGSAGISELSGAKFDEVAITAPISPHPRARRLLRFSVRTLLMAVIAIGCGLGWIAAVVRAGTTQRSIVNAINLAGGWALYDTEWEDDQKSATWKPRWPKEVVDQVGINYLGNVVFVNLHDRGSDDLFAELGRLTHLKQLHRPGPAVTDKGLGYLRGLRDLRLLSLEGSGVTDAGLCQLTGLASLRWLKVTRTRITDAGIREIRNALPQLQVIR